MQATVYDAITFVKTASAVPLCQVKCYTYIVWNQGSIIVGKTAKITLVFYKLQQWFKLSDKSVSKMNLNCLLC